MVRERCSRFERKGEVGEKYVGTRGREYGMGWRLRNVRRRREDYLRDWSGGKREGRGRGRRT